MICTETKFAYRHKPTGKWCYLHVCCDALGVDLIEIALSLLDEFDTDVLYYAKNIIEEDLLRSIMDGKKYAAQNFLEFELVEFEIEYKVK